MKVAHSVGPMAASWVEHWVQLWAAQRAERSVLHLAERTVAWRAGLKVVH